MGYYVSVEMNNVRLAESKVLDGLNRLQALNKGMNFREDYCEQLASSLEQVQAGKLDAADVLLKALEDEYFQATREDGFIVIESWAEGSSEKSHNEFEYLQELSDLFEAGGSVIGEGEQGERWEIRFLGGSSEYGEAPRYCFVSGGDKDRVNAAFSAIELLAPGADLEVLRDALERAEFIGRESQQPSEA